MTSETLLQIQWLPPNILILYYLYRRPLTGHGGFPAYATLQANP